jgi:hypothetical protein
VSFETFSSPPSSFFTPHKIKTKAAQKAAKQQHKNQYNHIGPMSNLHQNND